MTMKGKHEQSFLLLVNTEGWRRSEEERNIWRNSTEKEWSYAGWCPTEEREESDPFGTPEFLFFVKSFIVILMEISVCNCDTNMYIMV